MLDCSVSRNHKVNWCLEKPHGVLSEIQVATDSRKLAIHQISFEGAGGSIQSLGRYTPSDVKLVFPLAHNLGELLSQIRVCPSLTQGFLAIQVSTRDTAMVAY